MDYRDPETAQRRSSFHQCIQIDFPGRSFVVDLQSYFRSLLGREDISCLFDEVSTKLIVLDQLLGALLDFGHGAIFIFRQKVTQIYICLRLAFNSVWLDHFLILLPNYYWTA
ncbi:hypothetical protein AC028_21385 (plasmid) [Xanthomonas citri pv. aurantifolii]|nr:hypothetical protein AC028_21385 [Xanthomonas citri pv. aurantifolii]